jgi:hypothetical protein
MNWMKYGFPMFVFEADKGAGSGSGTSDGDGNKTGEQNNQGNGGTGEQNTGGDNQNGNQAKTDDQNKQGQNAKTFTQEDVDKMISERLTRENKKRDDEAKAKQGQFEPLYQQEKTARETAETTLTTVTSQRDKYAGILNTNIDGIVKDWPDEVKAFDPGKNDLEARQAWVEKSLPLVKKLGTTQNQNVNGEHGNKNSQGNTGNVVDALMAKRFTGPAGLTTSQK